jgi:hypothetical protein
VLEIPLDLALRNPELRLEPGDGGKSSLWRSERTAFGVAGDPDLNNASSSLELSAEDCNGVSLTGYADALAAWVASFGVATVRLGVSF